MMRKAGEYTVNLTVHIANSCGMQTRTLSGPF